MRKTSDKGRKLGHEVAAPGKGGGVGESRHYPKPSPAPPRIVAPRAKEGHRVADFNTLDDLIAHAGRELGATHLLSLLKRGTGEGETKLYFPRGDGAYDEANVRRQGGYWHADGPGARTRVTKLPDKAVPIGEHRSLGGARRSFGYTHEARRAPEETMQTLAWEADDIVKQLGSPPNAVGLLRRVRDSEFYRPAPVGSTDSAPSRVELRGWIERWKGELRAKQGSPRVRAPSAHRPTPRVADDDSEAEAAGKQYAIDQINDDHFMNWIRDQLVEASKLPADQVIPLNDERDAKRAARRMLQQLEWDASRDLEPREIARLIGVDDTTQEDVKEFFKGFRETLDTNRAWLADELLRLKSEMIGGVEEPKHRTPYGPARIQWEQSGGGTGWRGRGPSGRTYLLRRAGSEPEHGIQRWNLHIEGKKYGPFTSLDGAKNEAEHREKGR